ncbi:MAG TPA: DUF3011 domain-containing protein [Rhodanobacteraceae bacterium]|nr:DUF3011 domain-containing protein [Rhodanobacteraceae bacterium]
MRASSLLLATFALAAAAALQPAHSQPARAYRGDTVLCSSSDNRRNFCRVPWGGARIVQQISDSACVRGRSWGFARGGIWVDRGCRARFAPAGYQQTGWHPGPNWNRRFEVRCSSSGYDYQMCRVDVGRNGRVYLRRQTSDSACVEGRSWGYNRAGVWVNRGCAGEFTVDRRW